MEYRAKCPDGYALFLMFDGRLQWASPALAAHPPSCFDEDESLLTFPSHESAWSEKVSSPGNSFLSMRSTTVILCVSNNVEFSCDPDGRLGFGAEVPVAEILDFCLLFTLSIITKQEGRA